MQSLIGIKKEQTQRFLENGMRIPVTLIDVKGISVVSIKTQEKDKYQAIQLGFGMKKKATRAEVGHAKGAKLEKAPRYLREVKVVEDEVLPEVGLAVNPTEVLKAGDIVNISGFSKGKGFAGGVKRWGFHGGPKTHGQSDRHRAPGSIGQGTTPGRVYRGKKMAGNMGNDNVTVENLKVVDVNNDVVMIKGLVPGILNSLLVINKVGEDKKFVPLYVDPSTIEEVVEAAEEAPVVEAPVEDVVEEVKAEAETVESEAVEAEVAEAPAEEKAEEAVEGKIEEEVSDVEPVVEVNTEEVKEGEEDGSK